MLAVREAKDSFPQTRDIGTKTSEQPKLSCMIQPMAHTKQRTVRNPEAYLPLAEKYSCR
jgi:hypothetical protein